MPMIQSAFRPLLLAAILLPAAARLSAEDATVSAAFGAKVFAENCTRCHEPPSATARDARAWRAISLHMRLFADLTREDQQRVLAFLRANNVTPSHKD